MAPAAAGAEAPIMLIIDPVAMPLAIMAVIASGVMEAAHSAEWLAEPAMAIGMVEPDIMAAVLMGLTAAADAFSSVGAPAGDAPHPAKRAMPRTILIILIERLLTGAELHDWLSLPKPACIRLLSAVVTRQSVLPTDQAPGPGERLHAAAEELSTCPHGRIDE